MLWLDPAPLLSWWLAGSSLSQLFGSAQWHIPGGCIPGQQQGGQLRGLPGASKVEEGEHLSGDLSLAPRGFSSPSWILQAFFLCVAGKRSSSRRG